MIQPDPRNVLADRDRVRYETRRELYPTRVADVLNGRGGLMVFAFAFGALAIAITLKLLDATPAIYAASLSVAGLLTMFGAFIAHGLDRLWAMLRSLDGRARQPDRRADLSTEEELRRCSLSERRDHLAVLRNHIVTARSVLTFPLSSRVLHLEKIPVAVAAAAAAVCLRHHYDTAYCVLLVAVAIWSFAFAYLDRARRHERLLVRSLDEVQ